MARLTDQEQQEIIHFIEADKSLPDKWVVSQFESSRPMISSSDQR